ncbi:head-tail adaptor protein [Streptomyces sp. HU2014]|uniref:phage head completion protein n=1 Tax=Streptomyces sp. HU2014 TaxID=2939414 RepID=UPI00200BCBC5|nr:head-tail adaptor protein [Streptomyces sp. HU2014]UQI44636.1 head-tail adaptor protein [Streptomyces sp. HU2014]
MPHFADHVEVQRAEVVESSYSRRRDWTKARTIWAGRASVQPARASEVAGPDRETAQDRVIVYLPLDAAVDSTDRLLWGGRTYDVDGTPMRWTHGSLRHTRVQGRRSEH